MKPIAKTAVFVSSACALIGLVLWGATGGEAEFQMGSEGSQPMASHAASPAVSASTSARTRVGERPTAAVLELRNLLSHHVSLKTSTGIDFAVLERLRAKLDALDSDELLELLRELDASAASDQDKLRLASLIAGSLARRDPELALDNFVGRVPGDSPGMVRQIELIFRMWVGRDVSAAAMWLDRQQGTGRFGAGGEFQVLFESSLVRALVTGDPGAAAARFAAMPVSSRREALRGDWFSGKEGVEIKAVSDFLREQSDGSSAAVAGAAAARLRQGGLDDAGAFLNAIGPTPEERSAMVAEALRCRLVGRDELRISPQESLAWIVENAPHDADRLTGTALGQFVEWHDFAEMSRLAMDYREGTGSDEVLVAFLTSAPDGSRLEILEMAEEISDPAEREKVTARFTLPSGAGER